ncbi:hypothetical protein BaRGS_00037657 [Batillaria attramentaria]|uniref:Uncharacterized protein n=1 Tax=Batillaria attramentaria TaxID=370345 RepID=A0ABD0J7Z7_9CAEN
MADGRHFLKKEEEQKKKKSRVRDTQAVALAPLYSSPSRWCYLRFHTTLNSGAPQFPLSPYLQLTLLRSYLQLHHFATAAAAKFFSGINLSRAKEGLFPKACLGLEQGQKMQLPSRRPPPGEPRGR